MTSIGSPSAGGAQLYQQLLALTATVSRGEAPAGAPAANALAPDGAGFKALGRMPAHILRHALYDMDLRVLGELERQAEVDAGKASGSEATLGKALKVLIEGSTEHIFGSSELAVLVARREQLEAFSAWAHAVGQARVDSVLSHDAPLTPELLAHERTWDGRAAQMRIAETYDEYLHKDYEARTAPAGSGRSGRPDADDTPLARAAKSLDAALHEAELAALHRGCDAAELALIQSWAEHRQEAGDAAPLPPPALRHALRLLDTVQLLRAVGAAYSPPEGGVLPAGAVPAAAHAMPGPSTLQDGVARGAMRDRLFEHGETIEAMRHEWRQQSSVAGRRPAQEHALARLGAVFSAYDEAVTRYRSALTVAHGGSPAGSSPIELDLEARRPQAVPLEDEQRRTVREQLTTAYSHALDADQALLRLRGALQEAVGMLEGMAGLNALHTQAGTLLERLIFEPVRGRVPSPRDGLPVAALAYAAAGFSGVNTATAPAQRRATAVQSLLHPDALHTRLFVDRGPAGLPLPD
jgi:hypothetical protein